MGGDFCPGQLKSNSTAPDSLFLHDEDYYTVEGGPDFNFTATGENVTYTPLQNYSADDVFAPVGVYCEPVSSEIDVSSMFPNGSSWSPIPVALEVVSSAVARLLV